MSQDTVRKWAIGCIGAAINSAAVGGAALLVDGRDFNPAEGGGWRKLAAVLLVSAVTGGLLYVKQHPLPLDE